MVVISQLITKKHFLRFCVKIQGWICLVSSVLGFPFLSRQFFAVAGRWAMPFINIWGSTPYLPVKKKCSTLLNPTKKCKIPRLQRTPGESDEMKSRKAKGISICWSLFRRRVVVVSLRSPGMKKDSKDLILSCSARNWLGTVKKTWWKTVHDNTWQ